MKQGISWTDLATIPFHNLHTYIPQRELWTIFLLRYLHLSYSALYFCFRKLCIILQNFSTNKNTDWKLLLLSWMWPKINYFLTSAIDLLSIFVKIQNHLFFNDNLCNWGLMRNSNLILCWFCEMNWTFCI